VILLCLLLYGYISNQFGVIGIRYDAMDRRIDQVYNPSPAYDAGLQKGDLVVSVNGIPVRKTDIDGDAGSVADIVVTRNNEPIEVYIMRVPPEQIPGWKR
jgi:C-terminal processing protease CtpA/Prc